MKLKALIVDDEKEVANALKMLLAHTCPDVEVVGVCYSIVEAMKACKVKPPDILFLDIEMPGGTGFDMLEVMSKDKLPYVIFTTAHSQYAIKAIKAGARDYILKPVNPDELVIAVEKIRNLGKKQISENQKGSASISVTTTKGIAILNKEDILYIKASGRYSELYCQNEKHYVVCKNIGEYEHELSNDFFFRVHKSYIINCKHVVKINSSDGGFVEMSNKKEIEISKRKKGEFIQFLK